MPTLVITFFVASLIAGFFAFRAEVQNAFSVATWVGLIAAGLAAIAQSRVSSRKGDRADA